VSVLSTGLLMVGGKLANLSCLLIAVHVLYSNIFCFNLRYDIAFVFKLCSMETNTVYLCSVFISILTM